MIAYGLVDILRERAGQSSFHIASEGAIRIEFMRLSAGQGVGPVKFEGDVVVTCLEGTFVVGDEETLATPLIQVVVPQGERLVIRCTSDGAVQLIWAPPFAPSMPA